jgi:hypothetical protein
MCAFACFAAFEVGRATTAARIAPSVSRQIPSLNTSAHTRRLDRLPSVAMSYAVRWPPKDSAVISVELSGVAAMPLGKAISSATWLTAPRGVLSPITPAAAAAVSGATRSHG